MKRREFIAGLGGAAAWPLVAARAQQLTIPVIVYLTIEYRYANGEYGRAPALVTEVVRRRPSVIVVPAPVFPEASWEELRASRIPVVFISGPDPVRSGLVASLNRPGGTFTGVSSLSFDLTEKILGLMRELLPDARNIGVLSSTTFPSGEEVERNARETAAALGMQLLALRARTEGEIANAFVRLNERKVDAILVTISPIFLTWARLFADLAARYRVPAAYSRREFAEAGGLMSYGYDIADIYRQLGDYTARILTGTSPADLPVFQPTKFELVINLKTAKALGLEIPPTLLAIADEVIE